MVNMEKLRDWHHCIKSCNRQIAIWWVDDCFYKRSEAGGYLPMEAVERGRVDPLIHDMSGLVYLALKDVAETKEMAFSVCSFEYAEAHWDVLNSPGNVVLLDVGYEDKDLIYGVKLYTRLAMTGPVLAECAYLTVDPSQTAKVQQAWKLDKPPIIEKQIDVGSANFRTLETAVRTVADSVLGKILVPPIQNRLWPSDLKCWTTPDPEWKDIDASSSWWFDKDERLPHTVTHSETEVKIVKRYLHNLFAVPPPGHWFDGDDDQFERLSEVMKGLVGANAVADGGRKYTLTIAGVVLLLAAATGRHSDQWLSRFRWTDPGDFILPITLSDAPDGTFGHTQSKEQARQAIEALCLVFDELKFHKSSRQPLVESVVMPSSRKLSITLGFDGRLQLDGKPSLFKKLERLQREGGNLYNGYLDFLAKSAWTDVGRMNFCTVNVWVNGDKTMLELVACKP